ncbi:APC family permease [Mycolicibacterium palauense]|uniref:APC family permease n=1 Tax=Mycolicibacterium palauense TaxID=2034511 RepID=UPI000BFEEECE|nr:APC family permease [Mycolicibacterium palauense]
MTTSLETTDAPVDVGEGEEGLARGSISLSGVLFVSIATMAPGAGLAYAIMTGSLFAGGALPLAVVGATIGCVLVAVGIAQMAKHISTAGGLGSFVGRAFHPALGFVIAFCAPMFYLAALPYLMLVFGNLVAAALFPDGGAAYKTTWIVAGLGCLLFSGALNYFGAAFSTKAGVILGTLEILVLLGLSVHMIVASGSHNSLSVFTTAHANAEGFQGMSGVIAASVYGFLAFIGFEAGAPLAAETKNPKRNVPRAIVWSAVIVGGFYILGSYAATTYFGADKLFDFMNFNQGDGWIGMAKHLWGAGWIILLLALLNSSVACANGASMGGTRHIWAMAHAGTIPKIFARTHRRWKSPVAAIYFVFGVGGLAALVGGLLWGPIASLGLYGTIIAVIALPVHMLAALSCPVYYLRYRRSEFNVVVHLIVPVLGVLFLVPGFFVGAGIEVFSFVAPLSWPINLAAPISLGVYLLAFAIMGYLLVKKPEALKALSDHGHTGEDAIARQDLVHAHPHPHAARVEPDAALEAG